MRLMQDLNRRVAAPMLLSGGAAVLWLGLARNGVLPSRTAGGPTMAGPVAVPAEQERLRGIELDRHVGDVHARRAAKQEVAEALLAGRATLEDAAERFRALSTSHLLDGSTLSDEAVCRDVLVHVGYFLRGRPDGEIEAVLVPMQRRVDEYLAGWSGARGEKARRGE